MTAIVNKTISYMGTPRLGAWRQAAAYMFITDESDYFKSSSDKIADELGAKGFLSDKVYASTDEKDNIAHQARSRTTSTKAACSCASSATADATSGAPVR